ncbi:MAG: UDP-4-amino-4,6-dideoxy-N-acetyl-beta-L-altrosamine N-acetyltransferase [bacterium]|jgi:UDP-4-amino-4,6-dideoxy-N-acetyl-beta-L-altrosamine N-acetyltransferase|nr:UDP-4-amino-4,6-dideoxy-N-acetyl-beta-L-altrosamine N-acetyltransferase [bacterium]
MIQGEKITLRALEDRDGERLRHWRNHPAIFPYHFTSLPTSEVEQRRWYESYAHNPAYQCFIIEDEAREPIGYVILKDIDYKNAHAEIGLYLDPKYQGQGYGKDAFLTLMRFGFHELNLHRLFLHVLDFNEKAIKLYQSIGFQIEGRLREAHFTANRYHDILVMSILVKEFEETKPDASA